MPKRSSPPQRPPAPGPKTVLRRERNPKCRGELAELAFAHKAAALGFGVAKPYGDSERFDFILISRDWPEGDKLWRVQIKSSTTPYRGFYQVKTNRGTCNGVVPYLPSLSKSGRSALGDLGCTSATAKLGTCSARPSRV